jgi:condensin-2 complex subunit H2
MRVLEVHEETGALVIDGGAGLDAQLRPIPEGALLSPGSELGGFGGGSLPASPQMMAPMMEDDFSGGGSVLATPAGPSASAGAGALPGTGGGEEGTGRGRTGAAAGGSAEDEEEYDPYEPLDPYAAGALKVKPFRRGLCRRRAGRKNISAQGSEAEELLGGAAAAPRAGLNFPEFDYALKARQRARRAEAAAAAPPGARGGAFAPQGDWAEDSGAEGGEDPAGAVLGEEPLTGPEAEALLPAVDFEIPHMAEMEAPMLDAMLGDEGAVGEDDVQSYEKLVQEHVQSFVDAASALEAQSELIDRVAEWKEKVEPALQESEQRKAFNIQEYEKDVVLTLNAAVREESGEEAVGFGALVTHVKDFEIARTFAAMLQLVNDGNVEIVKSSEGSTENFSLHLHKTSLAAERFAAYRAPSVLQERRVNTPTADPSSSPSPAKPPAKSRRIGAAGDARE